MENYDNAESEIYTESKPIWQTKNKHIFFDEK